MKWVAGIFLAAVFSMFTVQGCEGTKECEDEDASVPRHATADECRTALSDECEKLKAGDGTPDDSGITSCKDMIENGQRECEECTEDDGTTKYRPRSESGDPT